MAGASDRAAERRRTAVTRLLRLDDTASALEFERDFWNKVSAGEKIEATWQMVLDHLAFTNPDGPQPRLQRHLFRVERGRR